MMKKEANQSTRIKTNIIILMVTAIVFAILPMALHLLWPQEPEQSGYTDRGFPYLLHSICPCHEGDDECAKGHSCGKDEANTSYNLDNAPAEKIEEAERDRYFESLLEANRSNIRALRLNLASDFCFAASFILLIVDFVYGNHNKDKLK